MNNLTITIAGPGAGKTHDLKDQVLKCMPGLDNHRFCVVITYTNAATEELRNRISNEIKIPPNLFIGTIHSFLIRFIIDPYGHLLELTTLDKYYIDDINETDKKKKNIIQNKLSLAGVITYNKIIILARQIITKKGINYTLSNRIQYLFVDEYQDADNNTNVIIKIINKLQRTRIFIIGDPLQYIYEFRRKNKKNIKKQIDENKFDKTPLQQFKKQHNVNVLNNNHRSTNHIVGLINCFISDCNFRQTLKGNNGIPVFFIECIYPDEILKGYSKLFDEYNLEEIHNTNKSGKKVFKNLILTSDWPKPDARTKKLQNLYNTLIKHTGIKLEKGNHKLTSYLQEISRCIQSAICEKKNILIDNSIQEGLRYRMFCFYVIRKIREKGITNRDEQLHFIKKVLIKGFPHSEHFLKENSDQYEIPLRELTLSTKINKSDTNLCYSSIHGSKGLESTSVLVIAYNQNELKKWLDFEKANTEMDDDYRLGYVAFSRARELLCIACLEKIDDELKQKLESLDIVCHPNT